MYLQWAEKIAFSTYPLLQINLVAHIIVNYGSDLENVSFQYLGDFTEFFIMISYYIN